MADPTASGDVPTPAAAAVHPADATPDRLVSEEPATVLTVATDPFAVGAPATDLAVTGVTDAVPPTATALADSAERVATMPPAAHPSGRGTTLARAQEEIVAWVKTLASAAVYAVLIVTFGFQVARVEGQSMAPTLEDQDRLIVNKFAYRIGEPRRGDIVMLYYPLNPDKSFVKRVVAEEGDSVRIVEGRVYVNDIPLQDDYVSAEFRSHDDWGPQIIPEGYYFVMGDHRSNSSDSRHWGMVPKRYLIGKVQLRWWPMSTARVF